MLAVSLGIKARITGDKNKTILRDRRETDINVTSLRLEKMSKSAMFQVEDILYFILKRVCLAYDN